MSALPYLLIFVAPALLWSGHLLGGLANFSTVVALFVLVPLTDLVVGDKFDLPSPAESNRRLAFRAITWAVVPVQLAVICFGVVQAATAQLTRVELIGLVLSTGAITGTMGITVAHELVHSRHRYERLLGDVLLGSVCYLHWRIEHVWGHHQRVATPEDPVTARLGESLYRFVPRAVVGQYQSAWELESRRLRRLGLSPWHPRNRMIGFVLAPFAIIAAIAATVGVWGAAFFVAQSVVAVLLLEIINYVEHYGLLRPRLSNGRPAAVTPEHSWNSNVRFSNWGLFNLQLHSDHHAHAHRPYEQLRHRPESPQLPLAYGAMILIALIPPLWRRIMDPRVLRLRVQMERALSLRKAARGDLTVRAQPAPLASTLPVAAAGRSAAPVASREAQAR